MRFDLGIPLTRYGKLTARGLISSHDHADVVAALLLRARQVPGQVQARLSDSLYLIGPPDRAVIKIGRSGTPEKRLRGLSRGQPRAAGDPSRGTGARHPRNHNDTRDSPIERVAEKAQFPR